MRSYSFYKYLSFFLIFSAIFSLSIGFLYDENSAGGGETDFLHTWLNLQTFLNHNLRDGIHLTTTHDTEIYISARTPLVYIFHKIFNPFVESKIAFKSSVFFLSLLVPVFFYLCLKEKFKNQDNLLLILISTIVCLSPYFRTSAIWGNEENFGLITLLLSFLFLSKFLSNTSNVIRDYYQLILTVFF